jgi:hypothetical protein
MDEEWQLKVLASLFDMVCLGFLISKVSGSDGN